MILLIDNYDSFTYNLYQQIEYLGSQTIVVQNDSISISEIKSLKPEKIVISPGPGTPAKTGICQAVIREFHNRLPILGICLGHQCIGEVFNSRVQAAKQIVHGKTSSIYHDKHSIFNTIPSPFNAARYHSLALGSLPVDFNLLAWTSDKEIMAIQHNQYPLIGIQFHPESFMTEYGDHLITNFIEQYQDENYYS